VVRMLWTCEYFFFYWSALSPNNNLEYHLFPPTYGFGRSPRGMSRWLSVGYLDEVEQLEVCWS
jgi:hypothetical protein